MLLLNGRRENRAHTQKLRFLNWCNGGPSWSNVSFSDIYGFDDEDFALSIKSAKLQNSGHYLLEITYTNGTVCTKNFQILIFGKFLAMSTLSL